MSDRGSAERKATVIPMELLQICPGQQRDIWSLKYFVFGDNRCASNSRAGLLDREETDAKADGKKHQ